MIIIWVELMLGTQRISMRGKKWYFSYKMLRKIKILFLLAKLSNLCFLMVYNLMNKKKLLLTKDLQFMMGMIIVILIWRIWDYGTQMMKIKKIENKQEFYPEINKPFIEKEKLIVYLTLFTERKKKIMIRMKVLIRFNKNGEIKIVLIDLEIILILIVSM